MSSFKKPTIPNKKILYPKVGDPDGYVSNDGMWAAIPFVDGGYGIINNGNVIHSTKTYKQAMDYIKKMMKVHKNKSSSSSLEDFLK